MKDKHNLIISKNTDIQSALKQMDKTGARLLLVMTEDKFISLLSIGDIQRAIINNHSLDEPISNILRSIVNVASPQDDMDKIKAQMLQNRTEFMPIVDSENNLVDVIFWKDIFQEKERNEEKLDLPVIIMAGGKGIRMRPLTHIIPKPLIPIDEKTISEHIIRNFRKVGCRKFYLSVNYKAKMIRDYFQTIDKDYEIDFFEENKPLGTAGSLHLLNGKIDSTFFISNCDILIEEDYYEIYKYHKEYNNELTIIGSFRHYPVPYGTLETCEEGRLVALKEKPELSFLINSGMYILEPHLIEEIPQNEFFHITDLIEKIMARNGRIGVFPVSEKSWIDIGEWDMYLKKINLKLV
ncbi:MAG: nucleotidyltransferase family protein [Candidatus Marinimicrobia bacterium]|nr:nucleotidyltransferase family protein [Candidatus Neomarinimicrobiota bacterium]